MSDASFAPAEPSERAGRGLGQVTCIPTYFNGTTRNTGPEPVESADAVFDCPQAEWCVYLECVTPDDLRSAMRAFGKASETNIERALDALVASGAASDITESRPIQSEAYLGFVDASGRRIAWLHVGHIDIHADYQTPGSFAVEAYSFVRRVAFPGYSDRGSPQPRSKLPPQCSQCQNAPEYCECESGPS